MFVGTFKYLQLIQKHKLNPFINDTILCDDINEALAMLYTRYLISSVCRIGSTNVEYMFSKSVGVKDNMIKIGCRLGLLRFYPKFQYMINILIENLEQIYIYLIMLENNKIKNTLLDKAFIMNIAHNCNIIQTLATESEITAEPIKKARKLSDCCVICSN